MDNLLSGLIGVIVGVILTAFITWFFQRRQNKKQEYTRRCLMVSSLWGEIKDNIDLASLMQESLEKGVTLPFPFPASFYHTDIWHIYKGELLFLGDLFSELRSAYVLIHLLSNPKEIFSSGICPDPKEMTWKLYNQLTGIEQKLRQTEYFKQESKVKNV